MSVDIIVAALFLIYQLTQPLYQLHLAEGERDRWQRPDDVIESLQLKDGNVVAGRRLWSRIFSLKLAPRSKVPQLSVVIDVLVSNPPEFEPIARKVHWFLTSRYDHGDVFAL